MFYILKVGGFKLDELMSRIKSSLTKKWLSVSFLKISLEFLRSFPKEYLIKLKINTIFH